MTHPYRSPSVGAGVDEIAEVVVEVGSEEVLLVVGADVVVLVGAPVAVVELLSTSVVCDGAGVEEEADDVG